MSAPLNSDPIGQAVAGAKSADATLDDIRRGIARPDRVFDDLLAIIRAGGDPGAHSERLRAYCRRLQKSVEVGRCA